MLWECDLEQQIKVLTNPVGRDNMIETSNPLYEGHVSLQLLPPVQNLQINTGEVKLQDQKALCYPVTSINSSY